MRIGLLRKHDLRVRLPEQPFRILARLVEHPGQLVTREELIDLLWPGDTYVEFDRSLNAAVKKLRRALNDSPADPRFIQTLPKRGYRFIAPVQVVVSTAPSSESLPSEVPQGALPPPETREASTWVLTRARDRFSMRHIVAVVAGIVVASGLLLVLREAASDTGSSSVETGRLRLEARFLEDFAEREWMTPSISPDGTSVAFSWNGGDDAEDPSNMDIYIQPIDGGQPVRVTSTPGRDLQPTWSPDGLRIATWRQWPAPSPGTFVISLRDGSETRFTESAPGGVSWTPDGRWLVGPSDGGIVAVSVETREQREIVRKMTNCCSYTTVSPDGNSVAFVRCPTRTSCSVFLQPWDGGEPRQLTFQKGSFGGLAWTPDSDAILYSVDGQMHRVAVDGNRLRQPITFVTPKPLTGRVNSPTIARHPANGSTRMLFLHSPSRDADIWETDISEDSLASPNRSTRKVVDTPGLDWRPAYSPDGRFIAFESREGQEYQLSICERDGSKRMPLTDATYRMGNLCPPAWSPDGRQIAFRASSPSDNAFHIYTVSVTGGVPRRITSGEDETSPAWSRNGLWVYFLSKRSDKTEIWKTPSNGRGPAAPVSGISASSFAESPDGKFIYFQGKAGPETRYDGLYRVDPLGGAAEKLLEPFRFKHLESRGEGLYFVDRGVKESRGSLIPLKRLNVRTMEITEIARVRDPGALGLFSLNPDGRSILTSKLGKAKFELMLVEGLR